MQLFEGFWLLLAMEKRYVGNAHCAFASKCGLVVLETGADYGGVGTAWKQFGGKLSATFCKQHSFAMAISLTQASFAIGRRVRNLSHCHRQQLRPPLGHIILERDL